MISFNNNYYKQLAGVTKMDKLCLLLISLQKKSNNTIPQNTSVVSKNKEKHATPCKVRKLVILFK